MPEHKTFKMFDARASHNLWDQDIKSHKIEDPNYRENRDI